MAEISKRSGWGRQGEEKNARRDMKDHKSSALSNMGGHPEQVFGWRLNEFKRLGWGLDDATFLARTKIDLTQAERLLKKGATRKQVETILIGTMWSGEDETWGRPTVTEEEGNDGA